MNFVTADKGGKRRKEITAKGARLRRNRSGHVTREKILDAAEKVFAAQGISGSSLREIMIEAGVNIAAVNYYFGNKSDLLRAVIQRRSSHINGNRLARLDAAVRAGGGVASVEDWLRAYLTPFVEAEGNSDPGWRNFMRVLYSIVTTRDEMCAEIEQEIYNELRLSFTEALCAALPEVDREEINWRYYSVVGVTRWCLSARDRASSFSKGAIDPSDLDRMMAHILPFLTAGLKAPPRIKRPN